MTHSEPQPSVIHYGSDPSQHVALWLPKTEPVGTAVLIHGGYWRDRYHLDLMDPMAGHLVTAGWAVINLEYRRIPAPDGSAPDGVWEAMSTDIVAGIRAGLDAVRAGPDAVGGQVLAPVVFIGHSAGGQLALWAATALAAGTEADDGVGRPFVELVIALAPVADLETADRLGLSNGATALLLGGAHDQVLDRYRGASPAALLPLGVPQLLIHGRGDEDVPHDLGVRYATAAAESGDPVEFIDPTCVDHFDVIAPDHWIWRAIDRRLALVSGHVDLREANL